ncbi:hypothetical protein Tco_0710243 [Tanacetum coccineum]
MRRTMRDYCLIEVVPLRWLHQREQRGCSLSAAATVAVACASVRQWLAATVAAAWWRVARRCDMSNSDELRHSDNTTPISPKHPDTPPRVYTRRQSTPSLLTIPSTLLFHLTIRRTARISVIPAIEPNLAERARIAAINLDDYQHVPVTPPPSPSSPILMAAYQQMIAKTNPTQREYGTENRRRSLCSILENMDSYSAACLEELVDLMTLWNVEPRVEVDQWETPSMDELIIHFRQIYEDTEDHARDA